MLGTNNRADSNEGKRKTGDTSHSFPGGHKNGRNSIGFAQTDMDLEGRNFREGGPENGENYHRERSWRARMSPGALSRRPVPASIQ